MEEINRKQELAKEILGTIEKMFELTLDGYSVEELESMLSDTKTNLQLIEKLAKLTDKIE